MTIGYSEFVDQLHAAGNKTTRLGNGEANFQDYGNALSDELQSMITDSFDCEQDYQLQSEIAALYQKYGSSVLQRGEFVNLLRANGYEVSTSYVKSSYIVDNKATGKYNNSNVDGYASIGVYTISDGKGGEIVIADANGNGALEIEEVFMNQILNEVAVDVNKIQTSNAGMEFTRLAQAGDVEGAKDLFKTFEAEEAEAEEEVSQADYNESVESYLSMGYSIETAKASAASDLDARNMTYTGSMEELQETNEEQTTDEVEQKSFNKVVNEYLAQGKTMEEAIELANDELDVEMDYTGTEEAAA